MTREYKSRRKLGKVQEGVASDDESRLVDQLAEESEKQYGVQVNFRWERDQMQLVREAAELMGVSVSQYIKVALYRQAVADIREARSVRAFSTEEVLEALSSAIEANGERKSLKRD